MNAIKQTGFDLRLDLIREIQAAFPNSHVGGSFGLVLFGYDLKRNLNNSDLDITIDNAAEFAWLIDGVEGFVEHGCSGNDFTYKCHVRRNNYLIKIDLLVNNRINYKQVKFDGKIYNITNPHVILKYKREYANHHIRKHIIDLCNMDPAINTMVTLCGYERIFNNKWD